MKGLSIAFVFLALVELSLCSSCTPSSNELGLSFEANTETELILISHEDGIAYEFLLHEGDYAYLNSLGGHTMWCIERAKSSQLRRKEEATHSDSEGPILDQATSEDLIQAGIK